VRYTYRLVAGAPGIARRFNFFPAEGRNWGGSGAARRRSDDLKQLL